tara:strand:+ start:4415 stop:5032 length:618 start_codon:yes stop_codon:yes gene_type:complete
MFTGLIETKGSILALKNTEGMLTVTITVDKKPFDVKYGDSVAINGCCLTVTDIDQQNLSFEVSKESIELTNLGQLDIGMVVNMERALRLGDRLGGHMVSGHVETMGTLESIEKNSDGWLVGVTVPRDAAKYIIPKGSICLDGVSLTVNTLNDFETNSLIELMLIPTTVSETTFGNLKTGWKLNIETDMTAKFIERLQSFSVKKSD